MERLTHSMPKVDGLTFNCWTVLQTKTGKRNRWLVKCVCGTQCIRKATDVTQGLLLSCGCIRTKHSMHGTPTYRSWNTMLSRCRAKQGINYEKYGANGVGVCPRWEPNLGGSFENFLEDMGVRPENKTLNRLGCSKIYSKETCEWATLAIQSYDKRRSKRNESGVIGVRWREARNVWISEIVVDKERIGLYYGTDFFEAVCKRISAEWKYYGRTTNLTPQ